MSLKFKFAVPVLGVVLGAAAIPAMAQNNGGGGGGGGNNNNGGGGGGGRGNFNPQQFQQMRLDRIKQQLGATDDEFAALQPKLESVMTAQMNAGGGFGRGFGGGRRGGGGGGGGGNGGGGQPQAPTTPVGTALTALQTTLDDKDAKPEDIKSKLDAVRDAKKTAKDTLVKAQEDLKSVLTQRQEAVLVENNLLD